MSESEALEKLFADLWSRMEGRLNRWALRELRDQDRALDAVGETAKRAWRSLRTGRLEFKGEAAMCAWLLRIASNEIKRERIRMWREEQRRRRPTDSEDAADALESAEAPREEKSEAPPVVPAIEAARRDGFLTDDEALVMCARIGADDAPWEAVAASINRDSGAIQTIHARAMPRLRTYMFIARKGDLGGRAVIAYAFAAAARKLTEVERSVFQAVVLDGREYFSARRDTSLRRACEVVARFLPRPF